MVAEGCLDGVNEVYGFHNWPSHPVGYLLVKPGPMMSEVTIINLKLIGRGGHGNNEPEDFFLFKDACTRGVNIKI
jgi:hippurate hydrolase